MHKKSFFIIILIFSIILMIMIDSPVRSMEKVKDIYPENIDLSSINLEVKVLESQFNLVLVDNLTSARHVIYSTSTGSISETMLSISPNKSYAAFVEFIGNEYNPTSKVVVLDLSHSAVVMHVLYEEGEITTNPLWSPDGTKLAFIQNSPMHNFTQLGILDVVGGSTQLLKTADLFWPTLLAGETKSIAWEENSQFIQFVDERNRTPYQISLDNVLHTIEVKDIVEQLAPYTNELPQINHPTYSGMAKPVQVRDYDNTCHNGYTGLYPDYGGCVLTGPHNGIDISGPGLDGAIGCGTPVVAVCDGTIVHSRTPPGVTPSGNSCGNNMAAYPWPLHLGNYVMLRCDNIPNASYLGQTYGGTIYVTYAHLQEVNVTENTVVSAGQQLGTIGSTGNSTGPHVHLQMDKNNQSNHPWPQVNSQIQTYSWNPMYFTQAHLGDTPANGTRFFGRFLNESLDLGGIVAIYMETTATTVSGTIDFTNDPDVGPLCGKGDFSGTRTGNEYSFTFISNDPDPECDQTPTNGTEFRVNGTLLPYGTITGDYEHDVTGQSGEFVVSGSTQFTGEFTTNGLIGEVEIDLTRDGNSVYGYMDFSNYATTGSLCGAGSFRGTISGSTLNYDFISNDQDPDCGFDYGLEFEISATLSGNRITNGSYVVGQQSGSFWANTDPLAAPTNVSATDGIFPDEVQINWDSMDNARLFRIYRNTINSSNGRIQIGTSPGSSYNDKTVDPDVTYYYWVRAENDLLTSDYSNVDSGHLSKSVYLPLVLRP